MSSMPLGSFLRTFTHGHVRQLAAVARRFLPALAAHTPLLLRVETVAYVDLDDTIRRTYGYAKQGAGYGYNKVKGLNALLGILSTPLASPAIAASRLRPDRCDAGAGPLSLGGYPSQVMVRTDKRRRGRFTQ
ncbi:hypothetical protein [Streptomyces sp. A5-4]|uniref:hypothetical protein n=1 Tax=Streptomyces sp. A5-4 TaxID=3384771 RepID=UPI003DA98774